MEQFLKKLLNSGFWVSLERKSDVKHIGLQAWERTSVVKHMGP
jgi:hypothetical protein